MKIAVVTVNIGGIDSPLGIPKQRIDGEYTNDFNYHLYHEGNLPFPLPNLNNRLKAKYIKIQTHRFLPDYDAYLYLDGRIVVKTNNFIEVMEKALKDHDIAMLKHYERNNIYDEIEYIISHIKKGDQYLTSRYGNQSIEKELLFYMENKIPKNYPLYCGGVFCRYNIEKVNNAFDEWWRRCIEFSYFDQTMFSAVAFQHDLRVNGLDIKQYERIFEIGKHK